MYADRDPTIGGDPHADLPATLGLPALPDDPGLITRCKDELFTANPNLFSLSAEAGGAAVAVADITRETMAAVDITQETTVVTIRLLLAGAAVTIRVQDVVIPAAATAVAVTMEAGTLC